MRSLFASLCCAVLFVTPTSFLTAQPRLTDTTAPVIRRVYFDRRDVFDERHDDWFFLASWANALHTKTREYILEDELLFDEEEELDTTLVVETERNLRRTGLFASVTTEVDSVAPGVVDVTLRTQDRFSLRPAILFGTGGGITNLGGKLEEVNLAGTATQVLVQGLYRTENDIGWEGLVQITQRRLFRSEIGITAALQSNSVRTTQLLTLAKPYRTTMIPWAFSISAVNAFGRDFAYRDGTSILLPFHERSYSGWISQASGEVDRLFTSASLRIDDVQRTIPTSRQAFDNTGQFLVAFSSIRQRFQRSQFLNGYETEDVMSGAWGTAVIGRVFSLGRGGQTMWYVGGMAEQSGYVAEGLYLFGHVQGASGFGDRVPLYTYVEVLGQGHARLSDHFVVTSRLRTQTSWNWSAYRQLVLDVESGLRGYDANRLVGDNRMIGNAEVRWFPQWKVWIAGFSAVAFWDAGTVWNQGTSIGATRWHHAVGIGLRFHNLKASGDDAIFRLDFAMNLDDRRFGGIVFTTNQLFSAFGSHAYRPPAVFGRTIDAQ